MTLRLADATERDDLGAFTARVARLDQTAAVRLTAGVGRVTAWARTPFDVLVTRSVAGELDPAVPVTAQASTLLTALAVDRSAAVDPGPPAPWLDELPPDDGWSWSTTSPPRNSTSSPTGAGTGLGARGPDGPPASLLDQTVLTVSPPDQGRPVTVPMRVLFAMSGMGFLGSAPQETDGPRVRVSASGSWIRLDARYGAVVKRRVVSLPLSVAP